jgi:hypothetical protein
MVSRVLGFGTVILLALSVLCAPAVADDPKPTPENTIHIELSDPVKPQTFARTLKFFVTDVTDRSGNAQPMLVYKPRKGVFLDRTPAETTREGLTKCLESASTLAADRESADFLLTVYIFRFGLSDSSGMDFFGKVEFAVVVKNAKTGKSQQVSAAGTSRTTSTRLSGMRCGTCSAEKSCETQSRRLMYRPTPRRPQGQRHRRPTNQLGQRQVKSG